MPNRQFLRQVSFQQQLDLIVGCVCGSLAVEQPIASVPGTRLAGAAKIAFAARFRWLNAQQRGNAFGFQSIAEEPQHDRTFVNFAAGTGIEIGEEA